MGRPDQEQPSLARLYRCHRVPGSAEPCSATHPTDIAHPVVPSHARHRTPTEIAHPGSAEPCSAPHPVQHACAAPAYTKRLALHMQASGLKPGAAWRQDTGSRAAERGSALPIRADQGQPSMARLYRLGRIKSSRAWLGSTDWGGSRAAEHGSALPIGADQAQPSVARLYPVGVVRRRGSGRPARRAGPSGRRRL